MKWLYWSISACWLLAVPAVAQPDSAGGFRRWDVGLDFAHNGPVLTTLFPALGVQLNPTAALNLSPRVALVADGGHGWAWSWRQRENVNYRSQGSFARVGLRFRWARVIATSLYLSCSWAAERPVYRLKGRYYDDYREKGPRRRMVVTALHAELGYLARLGLVGRPARWQADPVVRLSLFDYDFANVAGHAPPRYVPGVGSLIREAGFSVSAGLRFWYGL